MRTVPIGRILASGYQAFGGNLVQTAVRVGSWLIDPSLNNMSAEGKTVRLEPKVMGVLLCLAGHPGETVSKEQLFQAVWPNTVVTEDALKRCIAELRRAFNDDARQPSIIETISKRGYRLIAPVVVPITSTTVAENAVSDSIVVLPFINISGDLENEYFADGITEEIIDALAQIPDLQVVARSSAFSFKGKHVDLRIVGKELNVRTVLEGSVRRCDNHLRITVQLVNAADGYHLWSERYDREMKDVFAIQEEIARGIAQRLKITFPWNARPLIKTGTPNLEAYQSYLKGRAQLYKRGPTLSCALACCQQAVDLDPGYALAWAGLADCYTTLCWYGLAAPKDSMPKAMDAARRAVALDSSLAEGHGALAMAATLGTWNRVEAEFEFLRAIQLNPKYIQALDWYALFLQLSEGRLMEGMEQAKLALASDPLSDYAHAVYALTCVFAGETAEGVMAGRRAVELSCESFLAHWVLQVAVWLSGRFEESVAIGELALAMSGRHPWSMAALALTLADWGKASEADAVYCELQARARRQYVPPALLAVVASAAGRGDEAIRHAFEAYEIRDPNCQNFFSRYSHWSTRLYGYARFREVVVQMGRSEWLRDPLPA